MANIRFGYLNFADLATLTASPVMGTTTPVTYLQNDARGLLCVATAAGSQVINGTWGGTAYNGIAEFTLWRMNVAFGDTIRLQLYSDAAWTTQVYDSTALAAYSSGLFDNWGWSFYNFYFAAVNSVKSFKITVATASAILSAQRLYLGPYTEAPYNPNYGFVLTPDSLSKLSRSDGGSLRSLTKAQFRTAQFDMQVQLEADRAAWFEIGRDCDITQSFVMSLYPGVGGTQERDYTLFGHFEKPITQKIAGVTRYDHSVRVTEI